MSKQAAHYDFMDEINRKNLEADKFTRGKWATFGSPFRNEKHLEELFSLFNATQINLPCEIKIADFGSAEGLVGEYFRNKLTQTGHNVSLTLIDTIKEHLAANKNVDTKKICKDLLTLDYPETFNLGLIRSVLHYFNKENQMIVLQNIRNSLLPSGYLLLQAFVQYPENMNLYMTMNRMIGKNFQLVDEKTIFEILEKSGYKNSILLGEVSTFYFDSKYLQKRYKLSDSTLEEMRKEVYSTPPENRLEFKISEIDFSIPVPYKVFLAQK